MTIISLASKPKFLKERLTNLFRKIENIDKALSSEIKR